MIDFSVKQELVVKVPSGKFIIVACDFPDDAESLGSCTLQVDYDTVGEAEVNEWEVQKVILHLIERQLADYGKNDTKATDSE